MTTFAARSHKLPSHYRTVSDCARWLYEYGHFEGTGVRSRDLPKLSGSEEEIRRAVRSIQTLDANLSQLIELHHGPGRAYVPDGEIGPATRELLSLPRCANKDVYDESTKLALAAWREEQAQTGSGSWPVPGCDEADPDRDEVHSIRIALDIRRMALSRDYLDLAIAAAQRAAWEVGLRPRYLINGVPEEAEIAVRFESLRGSTIGWNEFPTPGTCGQTIQGRLDTGYQPGGERGYMWFANLLVHEQFGHGAGLPHTRGGVMNPSILLVDPVSYRPRDPSLQRMTRYFGGADVTPTTDPDPESPTTPDPEKPVLPWSEIVEIVITLIRECGDGRRESIRDPSPRQRYAFERRVRRRLRMPRSEWRERGAAIMEDIYSEARQATDAEVDAVLADAAEDDEQTPDDDTPGEFV